MADEADPQVAEQATTVDETTTDSAPGTETQDSDASSTEQAGETTEPNQSEAPASTDDKKPSETTEDKHESKPLSRRSAAFRIQQLVDENKILKQQLESKPADDWENPQSDDKSDIKALVAEEVEKRLNPVMSESQKIADDAEINDLFAGLDAERPKYEPQIRKLWNLPQYKDVAAQDLFNMLRGKDLDKTIATAKQQAVEEHKRATKEANDSSASGNSNTNRNSKTEKTAWDKTDEEFQATVNKVRAGG